MRFAAPLALLALLAAPAAQACSLAYTPFAGATFDGGDLWYGDGTELRQARGAVEAAVADGFFLSFSVLDDGLLVAGQRGLGADCSGTGWVELRRGGQAVWRREGAKAEDAAVLRSAAGSFVRIGGDVLRLDGDRLVPHASRWGDAWLVAVTDDGELVQQATDELRIGDRVMRLDGYLGVAGSHGGVVAVTASAPGGGRTTLHLVEGTQVRNVTWSNPEGWGSGLAWAGDAWHVIAGGRAYRVQDGVVTDLGVAEARAVAARGDQAAVFTEGGYTVFDGPAATEAWRRDGGVWSPVPPEAGPAARVHATVSEPGPWALETAFEEGMTTGPDGDDVLDIPGPGIALLLPLGLAVALRRRTLR